MNPASVTASVKGAEIGKDERRPRGFQLGILWGCASLFSILLSPLAPWLAERSGAFCIVKEFTGVPCPGCGTTRAALALARFDIVGAFTSYPLQSAAWTLFIAGGLAAAAWSLAGRDLPSLPRPMPKWVFAVAVIAVLSNWAFCIATGV